MGIDIFTGKKLEDIVPSSHNCDVITFTFLFCLNNLNVKTKFPINVAGWLSKSISSYISVGQVPHVTRTDYQLIDISEDGFVSFNYLFIFIFIGLHDLYPQPRGCNGGHLPPCHGHWLVSVI